MAKNYVGLGFLASNMKRQAKQKPVQPGKKPGRQEGVWC